MRVCTSTTTLAELRMTATQPLSQEQLGPSGSKQTFRSRARTHENHQKIPHIRETCIDKGS